MNIQFLGSPSLDDLLTEKRAKRIKVADLNQFMHVSDNLLIHKAQKDIWALNEDGTIERLVDSDGPLEI